MKLFAFDTETHLIQPGLIAPPMVVGSTATDTPGDERVLSKLDALAAFRAACEDPTVTVGGQAISFDFGVVCVEDPSLVALVFRILEEGRAVDAAILEKLHTIATLGSEGLDRVKNNLAALEQRHLGIDRSALKDSTEDFEDGETPNGWRLSYAHLEHLDISQFPPDAIQYPRDDARGAHSVLRKQLAPRQEIPQVHDFFGGVPGQVSCVRCGGFDPAAVCSPVVVERFNTQCIVAEMRAAWFLRLASIWGMRTDAGMVPDVVAEIVDEHVTSRGKFFGYGIVKVRPCNKKDGVYERGDEIDLDWLAVAEDSIRALPDAPAWVEERLKDIEKCRRALAKDPSRPLRFAEDKGRLKGLVSKAYQGDPPLTDGGESGNRQVSTSRDTLSESEDPLLEDYAESGANEKMLSTYVSVLQQGTKVPICPDANSLVATQRTSYKKPNLQNLPRGGRIRYCFVPRGYEDVEVTP